MVILRYLLFASIVFMSVQRFRILLSYLLSSITYNNRDVLIYFLIAKAAVSHVNPYLPLDELARIFVGPIPFIPHPAPCTPVLITAFTPFTRLSLDQLVLGMFIFEIILLLILAGLSTILWRGKLDWLAAGIIFFILYAWYPVANDLSYGQTSILLALLLLGTLLAIEKKLPVLAGILTGLSVAIKLITWPLIIYFLLKKDWRSLISSIITTLGLNLIALTVIGFGPFTQYYLKVSAQVMPISQSVLVNYSFWSIGSRLFSGTGSKVFSDFLNAPPLVNLPGLAPIFTGLLIIGCLAMVFIRIRSFSNIEMVYAILVCLIVAISPWTEPHYFTMLIIPLIILFKYLSAQSFPPWQTLAFVLVCLLQYLFNEQIINLIIFLNGGAEYLATIGNRISFVSSLVSWVPMLELGILFTLLYRSHHTSQLAQE